MQTGHVYETFGISKHFPVKLQVPLIRAKTLDNPLTAKCFIYAVTCWPSFFRVDVSLVNIEFPCHCLLFLSGCVSVYFYFFKRGKFFKTILSALAKQALLQFLVCALACANCKCACF